MSYVPQFYRYMGSVPSETQGLVEGIQSGIDWGQKVKGTKLSQQKTKQAIEQSEKEFPLDMEFLQAQSDNVRANANLAPEHKDLLLAQIQHLKDTSAFIQEQTKQLPKLTDIKAQQVTQVGNRFGPAYQMAKIAGLMNKPERDLWKADNQQQFLDLLNNYANAANQDITQKLQSNTASPTTEITEPDTTGLTIQPESYGDLAAAVTQSGKGTALSTEFTTPTKKLINFKLNNMYNANRNNLTNQQKMRQDFARDFEKWLVSNRTTNAAKIQDAVQYAGLLGKSKELADSWLNQNPDRIANLDWFENQFKPTAVNLVKRMENMGATDSQRSELKTMIGNIQNIKSNPQRALRAINNFVDMSQQISDSVIDQSEMVGTKGSTRLLWSTPKFSGTYIPLSPEFDATSQKAKPTKEEFIQAARLRPRNKNLTDKQLEDYYDTKYGSR